MIKINGKDWNVEISPEAIAAVGSLMTGVAMAVTSQQRPKRSLKPDPDPRRIEVED